MNPLPASESKALPDDLFVAGIASSAGGILPLQDMLEHASCHKSMCFVVVSHMARFSKSQIGEILSRATGLEAITIEEGMRPQRCHLYVIPENRYVKIVKGRFQLLPRPESGPNQSADVFFESLAEDRGPLAIGIVLSGARVGKDGSQGVIAIKNAKGHTYAQDPQTAEFPQMPEAAIETGAIDSVMTPSNIGLELSLISQAT